MRILVTGREGQVARALSELGPAKGHTIVALGRPILDLAAEPDSITEAIQSERVDVIVSAAAYTAVDRAESEPELAFAVNERGAAAVARAARMMSVPLIHLSTDYVFDGEKEAAYVEEDAANPKSVYGASKLAGEKALLNEHHDSAILRTAWVYSPFGANFVKTMLRLAADRDQIQVVGDQRGTPTSAFDIANAVLAVALNMVDSSDVSMRGIFHMAGSGETNWAEFAQEIFASSAKMGGPSAAVRPITTAEYPTKARRPANSRLNSDRLARVHGVRLPAWRESLNPVMQRLTGDC